ncbi:MAG: GSCFA domain-containing protein [Prevotellaceae bacterium]|nr:GSCFA domain-containing protein [Prevotellaceae bacterium]
MPIPQQLFRTLVPIPAPFRKINVEDHSVFIGSCFAEVIGNMFSKSRLNAMFCPLGETYSPASIALALDTRKVSGTAESLTGWHTWLTDTSMVRETEEECLRVAQEAVDDLQEALLKADHLFLTFGTNHVYRLAETGQIVANCHKHRRTEFNEEVWDTELMTETMDGALCRLRERNPNFDVTLTVSPYRYSMYGFHESNLAKAHLLLTAEALQKRHPDWIQYFPAYEIVKDELRDYRFYADDMLHPSAQTMRYIMGKMREWMDADLLKYLERWGRVERSLQHRPLLPMTIAHQRFAEQTRAELERLQQDYPMLQIVR